MVLIVFIVFVATAIGIYLKNKTQTRANTRSNRILQKQEALLTLLKEKSKDHGNLFY